MRSSGDEEAVTRVLARIGAGEEAAATELLPLLYDELHRLARIRMRAERNGHTLSPTALVHEAYLRLIDGGDQGWAGRGHFFSAAAEAMRRILADQARARLSTKRGGRRRRIDLHEEDFAEDDHTLELLEVDEALAHLEEIDAQLARLVKLRYFAGLSVRETAQALDLAPRTVERRWALARAWLRTEMRKEVGDSG